MRIVMPGGTGQVGAVLHRSLTAAGHDVAVLTRRPTRDHEIHWDGETLGPWAEVIDGCDAVVNLAGRSVSCRYNLPNLRVMLASRVRSARLVGPVAGGAQYVSWIHSEDFARAVAFLIEREDLAGPVNLASPNPLPQRELMRGLRRAWGAPFGLPATKWMAELGAFAMRSDTGSCCSRAVGWCPAGSPRRASSSTGPTGPRPPRTWSNVCGTGPDRLDSGAPGSAWQYPGGGRQQQSAYREGHRFRSRGRVEWSSNEAATAE